MISVNSPITIKTRIGTVIVTVEEENIIIETFQTDGKKKYKLSAIFRDAKLNEIDFYE